MLYNKNYNNDFLPHMAKNKSKKKEMKLAMFNAYKLKIEVFAVITNLQKPPKNHQKYPLVAPKLYMSIMSQIPQFYHSW